MFSEDQGGYSPPLPRREPEPGDRKQPIRAFVALQVLVLATVLCLLQYTEKAKSIEGYVASRRAYALGRENSAADAPGDTSRQYGPTTTSEKRDPWTDANMNSLVILVGCMAMMVVVYRVNQRRAAIAVVLGVFGFIVINGLLAAMGLQLATLLPILGMGATYFLVSLQQA